MIEDSHRRQLANRFFFSKGERASDEYDQYWIRFKPMRVLRKRFQQNEKTQTTINFILFLLIAVMTFAQPLWLLYAVAFAFAIVPLIEASLILFPTHISLTEDGLTLHWLRSWLNCKTCLIPWSSLSHVNLTTAKFTNHNEAKVEFNVVTTGISISQRLPFFLLTPSLAQGWATDRAKIILPLNGLASSDDRKRLQFGFQRFLPTYRVDPKVSDELQLSMRVESYTDLWLGALSMNRNRVRKETLETGALVNNGRYEVAFPIGSGGQAVVYAAIQKEMSLDRPVVLKEFILPSYAGAKVRKRVLANIQRESEILKNLQHPNIVKLLDFFVEDERAYLVLERIEGETLKRHVEKDGPLKEVDVINFALQMCTILSHLHSQKPQILHRDFTPDNLMIGHGDILKLIDFNVAQHLESVSTHTVVGKHAYIPPEQFRGETSSQSDIYAMGACLYYLLTALEPEPISASQVGQHRKDVSEELAAIICKSTATDVAYRFVNCEEIKSELETLRKNRYGI